jgi:hypothetical protein
MKLTNRFDGREFVVTSRMSSGERSLWRLKKRIRDFDNCVNMERLQVSFLTITQSDKSIGEGYKWITKLMDGMRHVFKREGLQFYYVAVLEIQPKRYRERGVLAPHWHVAIGTGAVNGLPHGERSNGKIKKVRNGSVVTWDWLYANIKQKLGMYFVCDCWSSHVYDYLGKYIAKGGELEKFRAKLGRRVRVFSASRFPVKYQMTEGQEGEYQSLISSSPESGDLYWRREDSKIVARAKEVKLIELVNGLQFKKVRYPKIHVIKSEWQIQKTDCSNGDTLEQS